MKAKVLFMFAIMACFSVNAQNNWYEVGIKQRSPYPSKISLNNLLSEYEFDSKKDVQEWAKKGEFSEDFSRPEETYNHFQLRHKISNVSIASGNIFLHFGYSSFSRKSHLQRNSVYINESDETMEIQSLFAAFTEKQHSIEIGGSWEKVVGTADKLVNLLFDISPNIGFALSNHIDIETNKVSHFFHENGQVSHSDRDIDETGNGKKKHYFDIAASTGVVLNFSKSIKAKVLVGISSYHILTPSQTPQNFFTPSGVVFLHLPL